MFSIQFIYTTKFFSFYLNHLLNYKAYRKLKPIYILYSQPEACLNNETFEHWLGVRFKQFSYEWIKFSVLCWIKKVNRPLNHLNCFWSHTSETKQWSFPQECHSTLARSTRYIHLSLSPVSFSQMSRLSTSFLLDILWYWSFKFQRALCYQLLCFRWS